jgi:hypothetical protein
MGGRVTWAGGTAYRTLQHANGGGVMMSLPRVDVHLCLIAAIAVAINHAYCKPDLPNRCAEHD